MSDNLRDTFEQLLTAQANEPYRLQRSVTGATPPSEETAC